MYNYVSGSATLGSALTDSSHDTAVIYKRIYIYIYVYVYVFVFVCVYMYMYTFKCLYC